MFVIQFRSHPLREQQGVHTRHRVSRTENQLKHIEEGLLVQPELRLKPDLVALQNQMQHKSRVYVGSLCWLQDAETD